MTSMYHQVWHYCTLYFTNIDKARSAVGKTSLRSGLREKQSHLMVFVEHMEADQAEAEKEWKEAKEKKRKKKGGKQQKQKVSEDPVQAEEVDENICQECGAT